VKVTALATAGVGALLTAAVGRYIVNSAAAYGLTRTVSNRLDGDAKRVSAPGLIGVEDIVVDQEKGVAYLSAADRRTQMSGGSEVGGLWRYDLTVPEAEPERLSCEPDVHVYPHGIGLWCAPDGHRELYVVDHAQGRHIVRRYRFEGNGLQLVQVFEHELIRTPNDLTVVGEGEFYVTNDHRFTSDRGQAIESLLRLPLSDVVHVKGSSYQVVLKNVPFANGIVWDPERHQIFVAASTRRQVWVCNIGADGRLVRTRTFSTDMAVDNIEIGTDGKLWIGGHPKLIPLLRHSKDVNALSPSEVIALDPTTGSYTTIYENDGSQLSGCTVGVNWRNRLLVGSVFEPFIIDCTLLNPQAR
jgi:arylesterase/paraoxonase